MKDDKIYREIESAAAACESWADFSNDLFAGAGLLRTLIPDAELRTRFLKANRARLKLLELAFAKGEYAECLVACRSLVDRVGIPSDEIKKLMGRTYEAMGDDERAAKSYFVEL